VPVLQVVHRADTRHLLGQAGLKADGAASGAVALPVDEVAGQSYSHLCHLARGSTLNPALSVFDLLRGATGGASWLLNFRRCVEIGFMYARTQAVLEQELDRLQSANAGAAATLDRIRECCRRPGVPMRLMTCASASARPTPSPSRTEGPNPRHLRELLHGAAWRPAKGHSLSVN